MTDFPHTYTSRLQRTAPAEARLEADSCPPLEGAPPPQFEGPGGKWNPEDLLMSSVNLCMMMTLEALAERSKLEILDYSAEAEGTLDKTADGLIFTGARIRAKLQVAARDAERSKRLLELAKKHCLVTKSLAFPVELEAEVTAA